MSQLRRYIREVLIKSESEKSPSEKYFGPNIKSGTRYEDKKIGYEARYKLADGSLSYWEITEYVPKDKTDWIIGGLWSDGELIFVDLDKMEEKTVKNFGPNLPNAMRYVWLMRQQALRPKKKVKNLTERDEKEILHWNEDIPDYWYFRDFDHMRVSYKKMPSYELWEFRTNVTGGFQARIEHYLDRNTYTLKIIGPQKEEVLNWKQFMNKDGKLNVENLARYVWLKAKKPIGKTIDEIGMLNEDFETISVPEIDGWWAERHRTGPSHRWRISKNANEFGDEERVADIYDDGTIYIYSKEENTTATVST